MDLTTHMPSFSPERRFISALHRLESMSTRRDFLNLTVKGSAMAAAAALLPQGLSAQVNTGDSRSMNDMENSANVHYKPPFRFGLGGVPLGNEFAVVTDKDAHAILEAAWSAGIRYYDVSPWYGLGLAERRYGNFLHDKKRSEYVISSKMGKLLKASRTAKNRELFPFSPSPNDIQTASQEVSSRVPAERCDSGRNKQSLMAVPRTRRPQSRKTAPDGRSQFQKSSCASARQEPGCCRRSRRP